MELSHDLQYQTFCGVNDPKTRNTAKQRISIAKRPFGECNISMHPIPFFQYGTYIWDKSVALRNRAFVCGFCSTKVSSERGFFLNPQSGNPNNNAGVYLCPNCFGPTFFTPRQDQIPSPSIGQPVQNVPPELNALYEEARKSTTTGCYTGAVLLCRKMLMNIAVHHGAKEGEKFIEYVNYLADKGYVPPNGKQWVDHVRQKGNEATHEIALMKENDAKDLITFVEMLLKFNYEFPAMIGVANIMIQAKSPIQPQSPNP